jgi:hypothetical protein
MVPKPVSQSLSLKSPDRNVVKLANKFAVGRKTKGDSQFMKKEKLLRLNLQFFAEGEVDDQETPAEAKKTESNVDNKVPYDRFKEKIDEVNSLKAELAKIKKAQEEAEKAKLEEQNEYKKLYEQAQQELAQIKEAALNAKKDALLAKAGYSDEQIALLRNSITGGTDEEISQSVSQLTAVIPPKPNYVDPSPMNGERDKPEPVDERSIGIDLFKRLKAKGKIK